VGGWGTVIDRPEPRYLRGAVDPDECVCASRVDIVGPVILDESGHNLVAPLESWYPDLRGKITLTPRGVSSLTGGRT
jgi:hypothetical protein